MSNNEDLGVHVPESCLSSDVEQRYASVWRTYEKMQGWGHRSDVYTQIMCETGITYLFRKIVHALALREILDSVGVPYETFPAEDFCDVVRHGIEYEVPEMAAEV